MKHLSIEIQKHENSLTSHKKQHTNYYTKLL